MAAVSTLGTEPVPLVMALFRQEGKAETGLMKTVGDFDVLGLCVVTKSVALEESAFFKTPGYGERHE